ncbi:MAG: ATP-binding protein [Deltaproteobacteria bacterium]
MAFNLQAEFLSDAFMTFRQASIKLEQQYSQLEQRVQDLTNELNEKNKAMERNRRLAAMGEMAAKIAHEIRNPLASMNIFARLLERELSGDDDKKNLAAHITNGIKTLDNLLSNMLLFAASPQVVKRPVDVRQVIEDSIQMTKGHNSETIGIATEYDGTAAIMGDEGLLRQVFVNLLLNSFDAMKQGGGLSIKTRIVHGADECLEIIVKDTGPGIPQEFMDRVFDPFFSTKERGTGLGLAIVSSVITAHGGSIDAVRPAGAGAEFRIVLPLEAAMPGHGYV